MNGTCPKCDAIVTHATLAPTNVEGSNNVWNGVSYLCPICSTVLGVSIDPVSLKADVVSEVLAGVAKLLKKP
jgi:transcription elongation factor Elf1